jgi:drug/metabolite transporter (DMT)-like permease
MVRDPPRTGTNVSNRGISRGRIFVGEFLLLAAVIVCGTTLLMSPHGSNAAVGGDYVRTTVAYFLTHSAVATLLLIALAAWLLFPARRPRRPWRDWLLIAVIAVLAVTSIYQLIWLRTAVLD